MDSVTIAIPKRVAEWATDPDSGVTQVTVNLLANSKDTEHLDGEWLIYTGRIKAGAIVGDLKRANSVG